MTNLAPPSRSYECPICGGSQNSYLTCNHPSCPDGRDRGHPHRPLHYPEQPRPVRVWPTVLAVIAAAVLTVLLIGKVYAGKGYDPNNKTVQWFEALMRPDVGTPCCGKGDAYEVVSYWKNPDGSYTAKVGDGSKKKFPDGSYRKAIPDGLEVNVPEKKVNHERDDLDNPTESSWIFLHVYDDGDENDMTTGFVLMVYCLIRHPQGN